MSYDAIVEKYAKQFGIPGLWIQATIMTESSGGEWPPSAAANSAYRAEPQIQDASYGLMQMLLSTARGLGFTGPAEGLYDPDTSIFYGTKHLADLRRRFGTDVRRIASAYNSGKPDLWQSSAQVKKHVERFLVNLARATTLFVSANPVSIAAGAGIASAIVFLILWQWSATKGNES